MPDFLALVQEHFAFLEAVGLRLHDYAKGTSFDNAYTTFRGERLVVGVARERGQCYFEVGVPGTMRYDGQLLAELLGDLKGVEATNRKGCRLSELADTLKRQLPGLTAAFDPEMVESTTRELKRLGEARAERLFGPTRNTEQAT